MRNVIDVLQERGLIEDMTSPEIRERLNRPLTVYAGFDPTSDSLQAGNLVTVMVLAHFQRCGHRVVALVGGGTGMIGDPSGKSAERAFLSEEQVRHNAECIRGNLARFLDFAHPECPAVLVNNLDWLAEFSLIRFLRDVGKHSRMTSMLARESVRARLESEGGMSFAEFTYQLLQAYDFLHLCRERDCLVQVGGSDQWGNITAGTDLIRRLLGREAFGVTTPLICDSAGRKFGKSEGNAVYLDERRTSVYDFYQFFVRSEDADIVRYLKTFTFLPLAEIEALAEAVRTRPEGREAQRRLAAEVTRYVHGEEGLRRAEQATAVMFGASMAGLRVEELLRVFAEVPSVDLSAGQVEGQAVADVACAAGLCRSKGEARRLAASGGLYVNNERAGDADAVVQAGDLVEGRLLILRSGKRNYRLVNLKR